MLIKVALELNFTFISGIKNGSCHLKKLSFFDIFLLSILKNCSRRMKDKKNITNSPEDRLSLWEFNLKKLIIYFQWFRSYKFFNEALQPRFFAKKMT
jgi:hypothetical protein